MKLKKLLEEFVDSWKLKYGKKETIEVFKNPTPKEMRSVEYETNGKYFVKYIIYLNSETIYVFSPLVHHDTVMNNIEELSEKKDILFGITEKTKNGKYSSKGIDKKCKWLKKYGFEV